MEELKLYEWQKTAIERAKTEENLALLCAMGCLSGDTVIRVNNNKTGKRVAIKDLFIKFTTREHYKNVKVRSYKEDLGLIGLHTIQAILYSGIKPVYLLELECGRKIEATLEHKFLTENGFMKLIDLSSETRIMIDTLTKHTKKEVTSKKKKPRYNLLNVGEYHPYRQENNYRVNKKYRVEKHRLVYEANLNGLSLEEFQKSTYSPNSLKFVNPRLFSIHHVNHDSKDNRVENLQVMDRLEHLRKHGVNAYSHFGHGSPTFSKVERITYVGEKDTYDIVCNEPYRNFVANEMVVHNSGKSCAMIQILRQHYNKNTRMMRTLILGPVAVVYNWRNELLKFSNIPDKNIHVSSGTGDSRIKKLSKAIKDNASIVITNYESFRNKNLYLTIKAWKPEIIVCDESQLLKAHDSLQSKLVYELAEEASNRYILTGTPILNSPMDLYMQFKILDLGRTFGRSFFAFRAHYFYNENASKPWMTFPKWVPHASRFEELNEKMMGSSMRVRREECLDLPERIEMTYDVELSTEQKRMYKEMKNDFITYIRSATDQPKAVVANMALTKALRMQQIVCGYVATDKGEVISLGNIPRLDVTKSLLEQIIPENKCILWCSFVNNYRQLEELCEKLGCKYVSITGEQNSEEKQASVDAFQNDPEVRICIANRRAAGLGINLTAAAYSIIYSRNHSLGEEAQSADRNYRAGSEYHSKIVKIDLCAKGTIDELIIKALKNKQKLSDIIVDNLEEL